MLRGVISEDEFDSLAVQSQCDYLYCPMCKKFYVITDKQFHNLWGCEVLVKSRERKQEYENKFALTFDE